MTLDAFHIWGMDVDDAAGVALAGALCMNSTLQRFLYCDVGSITSDLECAAFVIAFQTNLTLKLFAVPLVEPHRSYCREAVLRNRNLPVLALQLIEISTKSVNPVLKQAMCCPGVCGQVFSFFMPLDAAVKFLRTSAVMIGMCQRAGIALAGVCAEVCHPPSR